MCRSGGHTGGFSSASCPGVGFALRFAHTPPLPPPYTRPGSAGCVLNVGISVTLRWMPGPVGSLAGGGFPRISRWRSSPSLSSSESESESNVSASVRSSSLASGSSASRRCDAALGEDARERKDGGGEAGGHCCAGGDVMGESSSSLTATCASQSVSSLLRLPLRASRGRRRG